MECKLKRNFLVFSFMILTSIIYAQNEESIYMDFRNQKISDIIYSVADICHESVIIDETVTGTVTFRFEDDNFEHAINRFADFCHLYVNKNNDIYFISKVKFSQTDKNKISVNTENVQIEPFLNLMSRLTDTTILYDSLPVATVTIRVSEVTLEDVLNLVIVKLSGFSLERIASGFYLTKNNANTTKRNVDFFTISNVNDLFTLNIQKAAFSSVMETLFKKAKKEYLIFSKPNVQLENINFSDKSFEELLEILLQYGNCDYSYSEGIYYIFEIQKKDVVKKYKEVRILQLKYINTETLSSIIPSELNNGAFIKIDKNSNTVILTGSNGEISPIIDFITKVDVPVSDYYYKRFDLINVNVAELIPLIPKKFLFSDVIIVPSGTGFVTLVTNESEKSLKQFIDIIDKQSGSYDVVLKYIKSEELMKNLPPSVSKDNIISSNDPSIVFFKGAKQQYEDFLSELEKIDIPKQQIKYQLLVIQRQKTNGFNWHSGFVANNSSDTAGYQWSSTMSGIFNINFDVVSQFGVQFAGNLNAELSEGKSHVLADTTLNGISGEDISFSNTNTFRYRDIIVDTKGDLYTSTTREIASGLVININGWVSGDDMVTVKVQAQVSKQGNSDSGVKTSSSSTATNSQYTTNPPSTSEKKVSTNVRTRSGDPVIIGGLIQQESDITEKKVPFFGSIPILGHLFRSKSKSYADTEFVIYLVPYVEKAAEKELSEDENLQRLKLKYEFDEQ